MKLINFTKKDFIASKNGFYVKVAFDNPADHLVSVIRMEDDGTETILVKDTIVWDGLIEVGVSTKNLAFKGKILIR